MGRMANLETNIMVSPTYVKVSFCYAVKEKQLFRFHKLSFSWNLYLHVKEIDGYIHCTHYFGEWKSCSRTHNKQIGKLFGWLVFLSLHSCVSEEIKFFLAFILVSKNGVTSPCAGLLEFGWGVECGCDGTG
jgi:hypothetical protein